LADRGYNDLHYLRRVQDEHGCFLIRAKAERNPPGVEALREDGTRLRSLRTKPLVERVFKRMEQLLRRNFARSTLPVWKRRDGRC
jgi:hypothetical protein